MGVEIYTNIRRNFELVSAQLFFTAPPHSKKRRLFWLKLLVGFALLCVISVFGNILLEFVREEFADILSWRLNSLINARALLSYAYYLIIDILGIVLLALCFSFKADELLFRSLAGHSTDMIKGVIFYVFDSSVIGSTAALASDPPMLVIYAITRFFVVLLIDYMIFYLVGRKWRAGDNVRLGSKRVSTIIYAAMILLVFITNNISAMLLYSTDDASRYIGVFILAFTCIFMLVMLYSIQLNNRQRLENQVTKQLIREREKQYAESKENIDIINRKCHDLKHQISALKLASKEERESSIAELEKSVVFYDSVVKTGNEILDTILTEKTLYCEQKNIRLTCFVDAESFDFIQTVDLYIMLGNALDNAVEAVEKCEDDTRRIIAINIVTNGVLLEMEISNYMSGSVKLVDGLPATSKSDDIYHGFGVRSIKSIAQKYGGDIVIKIDGDIFTLLIGIPLGEA